MSSEDQGRDPANELGSKFMEILAKANGGVEEASVSIQTHLFFLIFSYVDTKKTVVLRTPSSRDPRSWSIPCSALCPIPS